MNIPTLYIPQFPDSSCTYSQLQQKTLKELQHLSGTIWTNYNAHDPGVTTADIANYVLTEMDYKLGFDLIDYLTLEIGSFDPEKYGMFLPEHVYPTTPVTVEDYRKLLFVNFPDLQDIKITYSETGEYAIQLAPSPFSE